MSSATLPVEGALSRVERRTLGVAGVFLLATALGLVFDRGQFLRSWLLAFLFWLGLAVGSLGLALLNRLTGGLWGVVPRRLHEAAARTIPFLSLAVLPLLLGAATLFPWAAPEAAGDEVLRQKAAYLNLPFFALRAVLYFVVWGVMARLLSAWSRRQDSAPDPAVAARLRGLGGIGLVLLSLTTTFAAIDWGMSLAPHWYSTIYGVLFIVAWTLGALAFTIVALAWLAERPPFATAFAPGVVQDLGKLLLTFTMLWAYVNFSQLLIVWSGNISEETPFYVRRLVGGWQLVAIALLVFHFALPFALLLSRSLKRNARSLAAVAVLMLVMQLADLFWLIGPDLSGRGSLAPPFRIHWLDLTAVVGLGALWLFLLVRETRREPLLPAHEPALERLLAGAAEGAR